jgi:hypothetical protein
MRPQEASLTPKAPVWVSVDFGDDLFQRSRLRQGFIAMPLEILTLPVKLPNPLSFYVGSLCYGKFVSFAVPLPHGANLKYLNALIREPVGQINFRPNVSWWSALQHEGANNLVNLLLLELA